MSDYTPTAQQVEDGFAHEPEYEYSNPIGYGAHVQSNRRAFRRWLAEVERAAAERAWWEACLRIADGENNLDIADTYQKQNPYLEVIPNG